MKRFLDFPFSILLYEMGETFKHGDAGRDNRSDSSL